MSISNANPSSAYFAQSHKCQPHVGVRLKVKESPESVGFILWAPWIFVPNFMATYPIVLKIFQSGPKQ